MTLIMFAPEPAWCDALLHTVHAKTNMVEVTRESASQCPIGLKFHLLYDMLAGSMNLTLFSICDA